MIDLIFNMHSLEIKDDIYERFLIFKQKHKPHLSNEDFILFLLTQFENCCSKVLCNGYLNGMTDNVDMDPQVLENTPNDKDENMNNNETLTKENILFQIKPTINPQLFTCPECKYTSEIEQEMANHFNDCHDMTGVFPCTCGQCFSNMAFFLAHYIICPIAATDLQNNSFTEEPFEEGSSIAEEETDVIDDACDDQSLVVASPEHSPTNDEDSNDQPLDFHMHSPSHSNPLNLVKNESAQIHKDSYVNAINCDNNNSSSNDKVRLPESVVNNTSSLSASPPSNAYLPKKPHKVYECEHCEKNFKSKGLLDQHKHLHFPPRHECEFCGRRFRWPPQFYTHKQQCSKRKLLITDSQEAENLKKHGYNFSPVTCNYNPTESRVSQFSHQSVTEQCMCGFKSSTLADIYEHKRTCIASARAMIFQKIIDYKTIQTSSLQSNLQGVNGTSLSSPSVHSVMQNFMPSVTSASNSSPYADNIGSSHALPSITTIPIQTPKLHDEKPFECDFCESRFMTKISLKQHLDGKHSDQAKYCCEKCGKGYFWNASYNYHKKKCMVQPLQSTTAVGLKQ